jgi:hypothetical protein
LAVTIRRLEEFDGTEAFDCGDEPLNNYLRRHAWINQQKSSIGVTYVAVDEAAPIAVLGYFTLATSGIPRDRLPKKYVRWQGPGAGAAHRGIQDCLAGSGRGWHPLHDYRCLPRHDRLVCEVRIYSD